jgi:hypothetical protein
MRRKQTGPEIKLFELDTLKYITKDNVKDYIHYIGIYPERMSPADVTFARKSGLLDSSGSTLHLSKVALHYVLKAISYREYAFLILSKQWIKTTYVGGELPTYNEPLLTRILEEILTSGKISVKKFTQEMDEILSSRYAPTPLSNLDSLRYIRNLLVSSELVIIENEYFTINPLATAIVKDLILNKNKFNPPNETSEFETFWNSMSNGVFDIVTEENKTIYTSFYPNLIK